MAESINIRRIVATSQTKAFDSWTKSELMKLWLCPENMTVREALSENKAGGQYLVVMQDSENAQEYKGSGVFEKYEYPEMFSMSWRWEGEEEQTQIVVEFSKVSAYQTNVCFSQNGFSSREKAAEHKARWESMFSHYIKKLG